MTTHVKQTFYSCFYHYVVNQCIYWVRMAESSQISAIAASPFKTPLIKALELLNVFKCTLWHQKTSFLIFSTFVEKSLPFSVTWPVTWSPQFNMYMRLSGWMSWGQARVQGLWHSCQHGFLWADMKHSGHCSQLPGSVWGLGTSSNWVKGEVRVRGW